MNHKYGFHVNQTGGAKGDEVLDAVRRLSLIHISEPTRPY